MGKPIRYAFRMTHIDNIPHILKVGIVHPSSSLADPDYVPIGDPSAIETRRQRFLNDGSCLGDYIPFYFGPRSPMLYVIQNGYNSVSRKSPNEIVYCVVDLQDIIREKIDCVFTDGHALDKLSRTYPGYLLTAVDKFVSHEDVFVKFWTSSPDMKRKKEAELLLKQDLKPEFVRLFVVYSAQSKSALLRMGVDDSRVHVKPDYYF